MGRLHLFLSRVGARESQLRGVFPSVGKLVDRSDPMFPEYPVILVRGGRIGAEFLAFFLRGFIASLAERDERFYDLEFEDVFVDFPVHGEVVYLFTFMGSVLGVVTDGRPSGEVRPVD